MSDEEEHFRRDIQGFGGEMSYDPGQRAEAAEEAAREARLQEIQDEGQAMLAARWDAPVGTPQDHYDLANAETRAGAPVVSRIEDGAPPPERERLTSSELENDDPAERGPAHPLEEGLLEDGERRRQAYEDGEYDHDL